MSVPILFHPELHVPLAQICAGDRLWLNGQFMRIIQVDRSGRDIKLLFSIPTGGYDTELFHNPDEMMTIEALPHAHRYHLHGPLTEEVIAELRKVEGEIIQSEAGVHLAPSGYKKIDGEWTYGHRPQSMAYFDPTITREEARSLLEPIFGRPLRISMANGYLIAVIDMELDAPSLTRLTEEHPHWRSGGADNSWIYAATLTIDRTRPQG